MFKRVGRPRSAFRTAMEEAFDKHGARAIEVAWIENPLDMLRLMAQFEPRQLKYEGVAAGLSDDQLAAVEAVLIEAQAQIPAAKAFPAPKEKQRIQIVGVPREKEETQPRAR